MILYDFVPEQAIMGQYLVGNSESRPTVDFVKNLEELEHRANEWDMSGVISQFPDRITTENEPTDYYSIVKELAKLKRNELRMFKQRFQLSMEKCRENIFVRPYRMAVPRTSCGFVFVPLESEFIPHRRQGLLNFSHACKYDFKLEKCLGVSFSPEPDGWYSVEWCCIEYPWTYDEEFDDRLKVNNPFRKVSIKEIGRYDYKGQ